MKDKDIDNAIENVNSEKKEAMRAQLYARVGIEDRREQQTKSSPRFLNIKTLVFGLTGILAVCLAIVLPIALLDKTTPPPQEGFTYTDAVISKDDLGLTIKEYAEQNEADILYIDWYDIAETCVTTKHFLPDDEDKIIYISEELYNGETGENVWLAVTDKNINVDILDHIEQMKGSYYEYNNIKIKWSYEFMSIARAYFEFKDYKYYVQLFYPLAEQDILDIVIGML
ncbi:MAG: hypothetical protein J1F33_07100 [Clostridiales bacterium]|nr:hypothetical protein [Clostridiales bacterium]